MRIQEALETIRRVWQKSKYLEARAKLIQEAGDLDSLSGEEVRQLELQKQHLYQIYMRPDNGIHN